MTATATLTVTPPDNTPPVISDVASSNLTMTGATIGFTTNEPAYHQVEYGLTTAYGTTTALHSMLMTSHSQVLTGLTAGTVYHYRVRATDAAGNSSASGDFTFTTPATPPPSSGISVGTVVFADGARRRDGRAFQHGRGRPRHRVRHQFRSSRGGQSLIISGGLTWTLVKREDGMPGVAEIWQASSPTAQSNISVTSTPAVGGFTQSLTIVPFSGAVGVGASARSNGEIGGASISLTTTQPGSLVYAVGNDWYGALARTLGANQSKTHEWVNGQAAIRTGCRTTTARSQLRVPRSAQRHGARRSPLEPRGGRNHGEAKAGDHMADTGGDHLWDCARCDAVERDRAGGRGGHVCLCAGERRVLGAGAGQTFSVTFTPDDTATYDIATATVTITVLKATPVITWPTPAAITYGTTLVRRS